MSGKGPLNYTTTIDAGKTARECHEMLARHGASSVSVGYRDRQPASLSFVMDTPWGPRSFFLAANVEGTLEALRAANRKGIIPPKNATPEQAVRTCWRTLQDWLETQLAFMEAGFAELAKLMLPYMQDDSGRTTWEALEDSQQKRLEAGRG